MESSHFSSHMASRFRLRGYVPTAPLHYNPLHHLNLPFPFFTLTFLILLPICPVTPLLSPSSSHLSHLPSLPHSTSLPHSSHSPSLPNLPSSSHSPYLSDNWYLYDPEPLFYIDSAVVGRSDTSSSSLQVAEGSTVHVRCSINRDVYHGNESLRVTVGGRNVTEETLPSFGRGQVSGGVSLLIVYRV